MPTETLLDNNGDQSPPVPYFALGWQIVHSDLIAQSIGRTAFAVPLSGGSGALVASTTLSGRAPGTAQDE